MDTIEAAVEAEVQLDTGALRQHQEQHEDTRGAAAVQIASGGVGDAITTEAAEDEGRAILSETSPLLPRHSQSSAEDENAETAIFGHLPWYKRPSIYWIIVPFFVMACAFGGIITPKLNLILDLVCREYISERMAKEPGFSMLPVDFNGGDNDQCAIPEVSSRAAAFTLWANLIAGILSAFTSPKLGELSDRYGRKFILIITSLGTIAGELITIGAAMYPDTFPTHLMLLSYALDGLTGSFIVSMSISNAYATDCTAPSKRNVAFGYLQACLFAGVAIGPILAGLIVKWTGKIVIVFYIMTVVHAAFVIFMIFVVPESLSKKRQHDARAKHRGLHGTGLRSEWVSQMQSLNVLEPLKILWPTGPGSNSSLRRNLIFLSAVDTIVFGVAMGSLTVLVYYMRLQFDWKTYESGRFISTLSASRVVSLLVILPILTRIFRPKHDSNTQSKNAGSDFFDLYLIRFAVLLDTLGYLGYTLARDGGTFTLAGIFASLGGMASPTLQSTLTKHVPPDRTGQLLGAVGLLHSLARVAGPAVFNAIYLSTVSTFPQAVFLSLCITFGLAFLISWFIRPHVYYDEKAARLAAEEVQPEGRPDPGQGISGTVAGFSIWSSS